MSRLSLEYKDRLCLECGLMFNDSKKTLFKRSKINFKKCPYCKSKRNIDIRKAEEIAPMIFRLAKTRISIVGYIANIDHDNGKYNIKILTNSYSKEISDVFSSHGDKMKYFSFHPLTNDRIEEDDRYVLEANFTFESDFHKSGTHFASFEYERKRAEMILEFEALCWFIDEAIVNSIEWR